MNLLHYSAPFKFYIETIEYCLGLGIEKLSLEFIIKNI